MSAASMEDMQLDGISSPSSPLMDVDADITDEGEGDLPQCKIKRNYSCNVCSFFSQNPRSFLYHMRDVHFDKIKIYECAQCLYASKHSQKLQRHINMIHVPGRPARRSATPRKAIERPKPTPIIIETSPTPSNCGDGEYPGQEEEIAKCSVCSFTSKSSALVSRHERVVHLKKRFMRCTKCSYVTHVKARFTKHVKYHSMPMIKCDLCDFRTPYKWNLDRHYKNHSGTGAFRCSKCNFRADIKQSLTVHEMNHHVPPVGTGAAVIQKKRNKVGASELSSATMVGLNGFEELELLRMEREGEQGEEFAPEELLDDEEPDLNADYPGKLHTALSQPHFLQAHPAFKPYTCKSCPFRAVTPLEISQHEKKHHAPKDKRPPPNLIPLQANTKQDMRPISNKQEEPTPPVNEEQFNEMCKKSSLTSSLKEFVSLIGDVDALKTIPDTSIEEEADTAEIQNHNSKKQQTELLKKKNATFFDKIKEKLVGGNEESSLTCETCGFESSCLSESLTHAKRHAIDREIYHLKQTQLSSTRCQHCRQRCKTSADLIAHLKTCEAFSAFSAQEEEEEWDKHESEESEDRKVFVWNEFPRDDSMEDSLADMDDAFDIEPPLEVSIEVSETKFEAPGSPPKSSPRPPPVPKPNKDHGNLMKKVFKCPHCSFWASTASRFHVHIVGHLNKKPFECSLCNYRSNWRWDITKHIRLKSARDPAHTEAVVNMTDETGRRNYSKYNKYLTMMKVPEMNADSSGSGRRSRPCEATQGTVMEGDILEPIPEPPKLIPAPHQSVPGSSKSSSPSPGPIRPPPPLQAAHASTGKKTLWKCKQCQFRHTEKGQVLIHVKAHYRNPSGDHQAEGTSPVHPEDENNIEANGVIDVTEFLEQCTESMDTSRAQHNNIRLGPADPSLAFPCDICPFAAGSAGDLTAHKLNHVDRPGSIFNCSYCPFFVPSKIAVLEHMEAVHGVDRIDSHWMKKNAPDCDPMEVSLNKGKEEPAQYKCKYCPYITHNKNQFLYHRQFHRPRDAPFKCEQCSYNVSRRHLLMQHVLIHRKAAQDSVEEAKKEQVDEKQEIPSEMPDIPLVWVRRGSTYLKMFKCRWCPHVNMRRTNIQEHEKMHKDSCKLQCPHCSYTCNNPGVLTSHVKVHDGCFGEIKSLVDPTKSDDEQIQNLQSNETRLEMSAKPEPEPNTPESSYYQTNETVDEQQDNEIKTINFCNKCPARFLNLKELRIHSKFHLIKLPFKCSYCSYTARQTPHLLAHLKVHSQEYQDRTASMINTYMTSPDHPQLPTTMVASQSDETPSNIWMVTSPEPQQRKIAYKARKIEAKHSCPKCPAKFFKTVALQYHLTLHGSAFKFRCKYCDYTVKTLGNLIKHQLVHAPNEEHPKKQWEKKDDPQYGSLIHGSPDFIYATSCKNGRIRDKRYKCHKCPTAFEKREQYRIHLSLHGSKQKYKCGKCDYAVKYFANYIQHTRKHKFNEEAHVALEVKKDSADEQPPTPTIDTQEPERKRKLVRDEDHKWFACELCPYVNMRKDCLENHERRHFLLSGIKYGFDCYHCDYSTTQLNFLREHSRVHFKQNQTPEAYVLIQGLELRYLEEGDTKGEVLFKDCGEGRFYPPLALEENNDMESSEDSKIFVDITTGDEVGNPDQDIVKIENDGSLLEHEDLIEQVEEFIEFKPKTKRLRGKNWRCENCPHAFTKKDQWLRHMALHNSHQKYSCHICDYAVKFYTNYVQHMKMHKAHEPDTEITIKPYVPDPTEQISDKIDSSDSSEDDSHENYDI